MHRSRALPPDIHLKLFKHLPLPALLRFQTVCKAWYKGIRNIDQVTVHGDCYIARVIGKSLLRVYSSRAHEGTLRLPEPPWASHICTTTGGLLYFQRTDGTSCAYNLFARKEVLSIPAPPEAPGRFMVAHVVGDQHGEITVIRVVTDKFRSQKWMLVYESERGAWETRPLRLPPGEELSMSSVGVSHATIDGSTFYFVTVNLQSQRMSVIRSIDVKQNVHGTSTKVCSWPSLPSCYIMCPGRPFTGNIAVAGGELVMACMRPVIDLTSMGLARWL